MNDREIRRESVMKGKAGADLFSGKKGKLPVGKNIPAWETKIVRMKKGERRQKKTNCENRH